jgi:hypothetical protein
MKTKYHIEITQKALSTEFSNAALQDVIKGNIQQDRIKNQFGHDYIHFDGSAFEAGFNYIKQQEQAIFDHMSIENYSTARFALGRITHSWQDFYSHSNYISLWLENSGNLTPEEITINEPEIMNHPMLKSGENYGVIEFIALLPPFSKWLKPHMPADSHARMNLDSPKSGDLFSYAYHAAYKQTMAVFQQLMVQIKGSSLLTEHAPAFLGKKT